MTRRLGVHISAPLAMVGLILSGGLDQSKAQERFQPVPAIGPINQFDNWHGDTAGFDAIQAETAPAVLQLMQTMTGSGAINRITRWRGQAYEGSGIIYPPELKNGRWVFSYNFDVIPTRGPMGGGLYRMRLLGELCAEDRAGGGLAYCGRRDRLLYGPKQTTQTYDALLEDALHRTTLFWQPRYVYDAGSLREVEVQAKDTAGRPVTISLKASFGNKAYTQNVRVSLSEGRVTCLDVGYMGRCKTTPPMTDDVQIIAARQERERREAAADQASRAAQEAQRLKDLGPCLRDAGVRTPQETVQIVDGYGDLKRFETRAGTPVQAYENICTRPVRYTVSCLGFRQDGAVSAKSSFTTPLFFCQVVAKN